MREDFSTSEIIAGFRNNDSKVINFVYKGCYQSVYSFVTANSGSLQDVKDTLQESLMVFYQNSKTDEFKLDCLYSTYIISVSNKLWLEKLRNNNRLRYDDNLDSNTIFDEEEIIYTAKNEKDALYKQMFKQLNEDCQKVLSMYVEGYTMLEINDEMNYKGVEIVKKKKHLCKEYLIKLIKNSPKYKELKNEQK